ncbi:CheY-P phosphatase CheC [Clostridium homopropionicum DSM 5847]|uniref:CheY-P phosphatase CheC n=1 Tax=Clostridium homopropionicum DSM 5847 TaxID=1121318 RepID=A0A0L6ZEB7_9CLOT|nr:chemotaxis protein CheC [Clostridium homopropionicum]KOA21316.1 CheY-P phosphatase CheC [Clostridium homopropionicum DSM 5847]SFG95600.1 chemotaxis protein CheC [Clostridium homopropionicum]
MLDNISREDVLKELFNISVGKSASILSEIIDKKILLDVPNVKIIDLKDKETSLEDHLPEILDGTIMISSISFKEKLTGKANLIFPADKMRKFINLCINESSMDNNNDMNFTDIDFDIIKEIGNIILNSLIGEIGNYLDIKLHYTVPEVKIFHKKDLKNDIKNTEYTNILMLYITFNIDGSEIFGAIIINLTLNSLNEILSKIDILRENFRV